MLEQISSAKKALNELRQTLKILRQKRKAVLAEFARQLSREKLERVRKLLKP